jgi:hypothetical protein
VRLAILGGILNHNASVFRIRYDCQYLYGKQEPSIFQGVIGTIVVNNEGVPIKSTLDNATTVQYSGLLNNLVDQVQYFYQCCGSGMFIPDYL